MFQAGGSLSFAAKTLGCVWIDYPVGVEDFYSNLVADQEAGGLVNRTHTTAAYQAVKAILAFNDSPNERVLLIFLLTLTRGRYGVSV
jgi:hypothetical protein